MPSLKIFFITSLFTTALSFTPSRTFTKPLTSSLHSSPESPETATFKEPGRNPNNPNLPELPNDFDWDEKYKDDDDWITTDVPGKIVLSEVELAKQVAALSALEEKWRKERVRNEYEKERLLGWTYQAEMYNGRFAMFFLVVGLLTEYWTGISIPGQIEEMLRVGGFIGFDT